MDEAMPNAVSAPTDPGRRSARSRLLPALATAAAVVAFVGAGYWQQTRMHEKEALRAQFEAMNRLPPLPFAALPAATDWRSLRYRPVVARGRFDAARQIFIDNRIHDGRVGYDVVAPLVLADGRVVLVDRGWIAQGRSRAELPSVTAPAGDVTVEGRIGVTGSYVELERRNEAGALWQNLDPGRFAEATGVPVLPVVLEQTAPSSVPDGLVRERPAPDFGIEKHWIYMMQWYAFAALAIVLGLVLDRRRRRDER
jgi:surfeit locus 1 family protein